ncbi:MAG: hypothetical protein U0350_50140 [Caldilineaceae bacterium]
MGSNLHLFGDLMKNGKQALTIVGISQLFSNMSSDAPFIEGMVWGVQTNDYVQVFAQAWSEQYGWGNSAIRFYLA